VAASSALILLAVALIFSDHDERGETAPAAREETPAGRAPAAGANAELALAATLDSSRA
jgi:hypothetical protein